MRAIIAIPATLALVWRAYSHKSLTPAGIFAATLTAVAHAVHPWNLPFVLLIVFFLAGTRVTKIKHDIKASLTLNSQGSAGEGPRTHSQVFANSIMASIFSLLHAYQLRMRRQSLVDGNVPEGTFCYSWGKGDLLVIGIIANYAAVAADTFSSELGILAKSSPRLITSLSLRKVPRGTNGGVTLWGLAAGFAGSMVIVAATLLFLPFCNDSTTGKVGGGPGWTVQQRSALVWGMTVWGALGSLLDSLLGGWLQRSVRDARSGKIVEGEGGLRVLVSADESSEQSRKGTDAQTTSPHGEDKDVGRKRPTRMVENGLDLLDNNDVNFLMAFTMSIGAMLVVAWAWEVPLSEAFKI